MIDVTQSPYNAVGDGTTDDRQAFEDAVADAITAGGGIIYVPKGTYLFDSEGASSTVCVNVAGDNVWIKGDGVGLSKIVLGDGVDCHIFNFDGPIGGGFEGIEIDGNRANQTVSAHAIRADTLTDWTLEDFYIHDVYGYGIGLQYGILERVLIKNGVVRNTGSDGIDIKNRENGNSDNTMSNVRVYNAGLNLSLSGQACIDIRGIWDLSNLVARDYYNDGTTGVCRSGIRLRSGETSDESGYGAHYSNLRGFFCRSANKTNTIGLQISAYHCQISNGHVQNAGIGVQVDQRGNSLENIIALGNHTSFYLANSGIPTNADRNTLCGCHALSGSNTGFVIEGDNNFLTSIVARDNSTGINIKTTANLTHVVGLSTSNNSANLVDNGTNSKLANLI